MGHQLIAWRPPEPKRKPVGKPLLGFCDTHPATPAVVTEVQNKGRKRKFCRECWDHHKYTELGLRTSRFK